MRKTYIASCYFKNNYGSVLQAYATQEFLTCNGIENNTIDISTLTDFEKGKKKYYRSQLFNLALLKTKFGMLKLKIKAHTNKRMKKDFAIRRECFEKFRNRYFNLTDNFNNYEDLSSFLCLNASNVVVGSDQLWLPVNVKADYYTLNFVSEDINKISYATSFGISNLPKNMKEDYRNFLSRINHLSVREESGKCIVSSLVDKECNVVCDPTLLLSKEQWDNLCKNERPIQDKYIFCYFLGKTKQHRKFVMRLKKKTGLKVVSICHTDEFVKIDEKISDFTPYNVDPAKWIELVKNSEYVCTDSFHCTVFSLIYNKLFFAFRRFENKNKFSTNSRIENLLETVNLKNRLYTGFESNLPEDDLSKDSINYSLVDEILRNYRKKSIDWFLNSLKKEENKFNRISIDVKSSCSGCSACYSACPKHAIEMKEDQEGFLYPSINDDLCINCGLCKKVCPILNSKQEVKVVQRGYLIRNKNELILKQSTSGGAFSGFAESIIEKGGVVFGACMDNDGVVKHICVDNIEDLSKFRNSKYVQSAMGDSFSICKKFVIEGRPVLFSGTPCQLEGLVHYLGKLSEKVFKVDVVCRAVPSPLVWKKYIEYRQEKNKNLKPIGFRIKDKFGYEYSQMKFSDGKANFYSGVESDPYLRAFFSDIIDRPSCYKCKFKKRFRITDVTIWDCFPIHKFDKTLDDNKGVTRCITHSKQGEDLLSISSNRLIIKQIDVDMLIKDSKEIYKPIKSVSKRKDFFNDMKDSDSSVSLFNKWFPNSAKCKVKKITRHFLEFTGIYRPVKRLVKRILRK